MLHQDEILLLAMMHMPINGDVNLTVKDKKQVLQIRVDMLGTMLARLQTNHSHLRDAATTLAGREQNTLESHLIGRAKRRYVV